MQCRGIIDLSLLWALASDCTTHAAADIPTVNKKIPRYAQHLSLPLQRFFYSFPTVYLESASTNRDISAQLSAAS